MSEIDGPICYDTLRIFVERSATPIAMLDSQMRYLGASPRWLSDYRIEGPFVGRGHYDVHPDIPERWKEVHRRVLAGEFLSDDDDRFEHEDGSVQFLRWSAMPWRKESGEIGGIIISAEDTTKQRLAEEALHKSELRYRTLIKSSGALTWSTPIAGQTIEPQHEWAAFTGLPAEEAVGQGWAKAVHPDDVPGALAKWREAEASGESFSLVGRVRRYDGQWRWMRVQAAPIRDGSGKIVEWFGMNLDITEQQEAEQALREREAWMQGQREALVAAVNGAPLQESLGALTRTAIDALGPDMRAAFFLSDGATLQHVVGMSQDYAKAIDGFKIGPNAVACGLAAYYGKPVIAADVIQEPGWENWRWLAERFEFRGCWSFPINSAAGKFVGTFTIYAQQPRTPTERDLKLVSLLADTAAIIISRHKEVEAHNRTEEARRASEERFHNISQGAACAITIGSLQGDILECNPAFCDLLGYSVDELRSRTFHSLIHPDDSKENTAAVSRLLRGDIDQLEIENRYVHKNGEPIWVRKFMSVLTDETGKPARVMGVIVDVSERRRAQDHLRELNSTLEQRIAERTRELRESEYKFRLYMDNSSTAAWLKDEEGRYLFVSRAFEKALGVNSGYLIGKTDFEILPPDIAAKFHRNDMKVLSANQPIEVVEKTRDQDGVSRYWLNTKFAFCDLMGKRYVGGTGVDVTDRRNAIEALRESELRSRRLLEGMAQAFWETNADGVVVNSSPSWCAYTGQTLEEMAGWGWADAVHPDDIERLSREWRGAVANVRDFDTEFRLRMAEGGYRWTNARATPLLREDGSVEKWVGMNIDIDARKRAEEALLEADQRKDEFLATLAHELRNPLTPIYNAIQVLKQQNEREVPLLNMAERQTKHLVRLVDDLLEISRITRGKIELRNERTNLAAVLRESVETCRSLIDEKNHSVDMRIPSEPVWILGDPVRLAQIAGNIINNAAKYTQPGGRIEVEIAQDRDAATLRVRDNGKGIPANKLQRVFDLFVQVEPQVKSANGGLGIGLALTRKLVELHGGEVEAHSAGLGRGCEFIVRLPLFKEKDQSSQNARAGLDHQNGAKDELLRALIVDDDRDVGDSFGLLLETMGAAARVVNSGPAGIAMLDEFKPDLIFVDIGMPKIDGYETARRIRARAPAHPFKLVALTGWGREEDQLRAREAGFDMHLTKPASLDALRKLLERKAERVLN